MKIERNKKRKAPHAFLGLDLDLLPTVPVGLLTFRRPMLDAGRLADRLCGVAAPLVVLLARPLLSRILARASSRVMVGIIAGSLVSKLALLLLDAVRIPRVKDNELEDRSSRTGTVVVVTE